MGCGTGQQASVKFLPSPFISSAESMNNKTRSVIRAVAIILVLLSVVMHLHWVIIPAVIDYRFWLVVVAFGMILITSK
jgi:hypothetical protein